tara:strand:- start:386 stop:712 length:327 start_codon:yes stop_codon:yes gene_type:complete
MNKSLVNYSLILLIVIPIFGFNFLINLIGNLLILAFLIPLLIFLILFISFNSLKSKVKTCDQCGTLSLGINKTCMNCGADLDDINQKNFEIFNKPSETTIEVKAEEIK